MNNKCKVVKSPKRFRIDSSLISANLTNCKDIHIADITEVAIEQQVSVTAKVISIDSPEKVKGRQGGMLRLQNFYIADATSKCRCVAWEEDIDLVEKQKSYCLKDVTIKQFDGI